MGKASARITKTEINIPVIFMLSVIPDVDIVLEKMIPSLQHRGPAHSIIILFAVFIPIIAIYRVKAIPYFLALIQHPMLGDFLTAGPVQLLWPLSPQYYGMKMGIESFANITLELTVFAVSLIIMLKTKDITKFFRHSNINLILAIPTFTVLLPTLVNFPLDVPIPLIPPHLFFMFVFLASIIIGI